MKIKKSILIIILIVSSFTVFSQQQITSSFSADLNKTSIKTVLKAVADWQVKTPLTHHELDWTNAALYAGMLEWAGIAGDDSYFKWLRAIGENNAWDYKKSENPVDRYHADNYCVGQTYIELYRKYGEQKMITPIKVYLDQILKDPAAGELEFIYTDKYWPTQRWAWCDALFMGPTVWAKMAKVTGKKKYLDFMYREYKATTDYLYDKEESLYFRDSRYFTMKEANGAKVFWGRGNGWVFAGLPIILRELPVNYRQKDYFVKIYKDMAEKIRSLQSADGFWHASLLDPASYPNPEMSATAFFVYGLAWGINNGYLDKAKYYKRLEIDGNICLVRWKSRIHSTDRGRSKKRIKGNDRSLRCRRIPYGRNGNNQAY
jgi:unsaturated rhamnogalacturonyl hydrolase